MTKPDTLMQRYAVATAYLSNQTDESWDVMVRRIAALEAPRNELAEQALNDDWGIPMIAIAIWNDGEGVTAQAYQSREAAERDFPPGDDSSPEVVIVDSTVQP